MRFVRHAKRFFDGLPGGRLVSYAAGLLAFHLFLLLTVPHLIGALNLQATLYTELAFAGVALVMGQRAITRYTRRVWMQGYATGHWDGLGDAPDSGS